MTTTRGTGRSGSTARGAASLALVGLLAGCTSSLGSLEDASVTDDAFRARVDEVMPGAFTDDDGEIPLAFFARFSCGALAIAEDPALAEAHGHEGDPYYEGSSDEVRARLVETWAEHLPAEDAAAFVDLSIGSFCPEYH